MTSTLVFGSGIVGLLLAGGIAYASAQPDDQTRAEAAAKAREHFARMDVNKDGKLDEADRGAHHQQMAAGMFDRVDTDRNGSISREEWNAGAARLAEAHRPGDERGHMLKMRRPAMLPMGADADGDQAVTLKEFEAQALQRFDAADADGNGALSPGERQAARGLTRITTARD